jgi:hypothetical protein
MCIPRFPKIAFAKTKKTVRIFLGVLSDMKTVGTGG